MADLALVSKLPSLHKGRVSTVSWTYIEGTGYKLASSGADATFVWFSQDSKDWDISATLKKSQCCEWSVNGDVLALGGDDISLLKLKDGQMSEEALFRIPPEQTIKSLAWNKDGNLLCCTYELIKGVSGSYTMHHLLSVSENAPLQSCKWHPNGVHFSLCGYVGIETYFLEEAKMDQAERVIKIGCIDGSNENYHKGQGYATGIAFLPNGDLVSTGTDCKLIVWQSSSSVANNYRHVKTLNPHKTLILCVDSTRNEDMEQLIASGCRGHSICVYGQFQKQKDADKSYKVIVHKQSAHENAISDLKWLHCEQQAKLASVSYDGSIKIWEVQGNINYKRSR